MDNNEFSFEAVFRNDEFKRYESPEFLKAVFEFDKLIKSKLGDVEIREQIDNASAKCCIAAQDSSFEQGFCFAVKLIRFMCEIR